MPKIRVHEKALAHLSRGLYRSPASALRELVSNAWDANATTVRIDTNYPSFLQLVIEDDGDGFTKQAFKELMEGGIGNSQKRPSKRVLRNGRGMIGRLGIGMLGIAQICGSFSVSSVTKTGQGFKARVHLYDLLKERLDEADSDLVTTSGPADEAIVEVDVGDYEFEEWSPKDRKSGTVLIADELHPTFIQSFRDSIAHPLFQEPPLEWSKALTVVDGVHSLQQLGDYWRLLWELSAACPIPYLDSHALPKGLARQEHERLEGYDFRLIVDAIELRKPVRLRSKDYHYSTYKLGPHNERIYGRDLSFHGYIVVQEGKQLKPDELRGIMIRIKDVGIGYYDASLLDYRYNEGPRSRWLTSEIFVDRGLEDALNVDRDSFNRFHPHFRAIQKAVHDILHQRVFPGSYSQIDVRSTQRKSDREKERTSRLKKVLSDAVDLPVTITKSSKKGVDGEVASVDIRALPTKVAIQIPTELRTKKSNQQLAASILAIFEMAMREKSTDQTRKIFTKLLLQLLAKW